MNYAIRIFAAGLFLLVLIAATCGRQAVAAPLPAVEAPARSLTR